MSKNVAVAIGAAPAFIFPDPKPLIAPGEESGPYPIEAFPPKMRDAIVAYQEYGQQPMPLVASSALGALSLAAQGLVDVARDDNLTGPISLNIAVVAESGERKTSADNRMCRAVREWRERRKREMAANVNVAKADVDAYNAEREGILNRIKSSSHKAAIAAEEADIRALQDHLRALDADPPRELIVPRLFYEDVSPEKLAVSIAEGWPSASLWSEEAGLVIGGHGMSDDAAMRFLGLLNRLWDGKSFERDRGTTKSAHIKGRRFTVSLMMQSVVLSRLMAAGGGASRGMGFLARFLFAWPTSTMGTRFYRSGDLECAELRAFDARLMQLLDIPLPAEGPEMVLTPPVLPLLPDARKVWIDYHDTVETELAPLRDYESVRDFASKSAENAARIAALFHIFDNGPAGSVSAETMQAGAALAVWHLDEARRLMATVDAPQSISDARDVLIWMQRRGKSEIEPREILNAGPSKLRANPARRDAAINLLVETNHLLAQKVGRATRYVLNPKSRGGQ
jgi:putative DNA primase/helicase